LNVTDAGYSKIRVVRTKLDIYDSIAIKLPSGVTSLPVKMEAQHFWEWKIL